MKSLFFALSISIFLPASVAAAEFSFSTKDSIAKGETFIVEVHASSVVLLNVLDGGIVFNPDYVEVTDISTGNSPFTLWPRSPVYSNSTGRIYFTGGNSSGWKGEGTVFAIVMKAKKAGLSELFFTDKTTAYRDDGKGTLEESVFKSYGLHIGSEVSTSNEWQEALAQDITPPQDLRVEIGRSEHMFNNAYFISFGAIDHGTGIDHYEIQEGDQAAGITESPYVLTSPTLKERITITALVS